MTTQEKRSLEAYRRNGYGYKKIADIMGISENTVKTYCKRNNLAGAVAVRNPHGNVTRCKACGEPLVQMTGCKPKVFCSTTCRNNWWNKHRKLIKHRDGRQVTCKNCGEEMSISKNSTQQYCSHSCYVAARFYGGAMQ